MFLKIWGGGITIVILLNNKTLNITFLVFAARVRA